MVLLQATRLNCIVIGNTDSPQTKFVFFFIGVDMRCTSTFDTLLCRFETILKVLLEIILLWDSSASSLGENYICYSVTISIGGVFFSL